MTQTFAVPEAIEMLSEISRASGVASRQQQMAARLSVRMQTPIQVGFFGADIDLVSLLFNGLSQYLNVEFTGGIIETGDMVLQQHSTPDFAKVDIAIWATRQLDAAENAIWAAAPDSVKDHSFLLALYDDGAAIPDQQTPWVDAALDEFAKFMALPIRHQQCEVQPLWSAVLASVAQGRQADQDHATYLIELLKGKVTQPLAKPVAEPTPVAEPVAQPISTIWQQAADTLIVHGAAISVIDGTLDCAAVLAECATATDDLSDLFMAAPQGDEDQQRFQDDVMLAADNIVLMSLENDAASATDAVTMLLQLQRDVSVRLHAA